METAKSFFILQSCQIYFLSYAPLNATNYTPILMLVRPYKICGFVWERFHAAESRGHACMNYVEA